MRVALEFNQALNRHDVAAMMVLMSDDCVFENTSPAPDGTVYSGKEAVTQFWQDFFARRLRPISMSRRSLVWACSVLYAGATNGWTRPEKRDMCGEFDIFTVKNGLISEKLSYVKG